MSDRAPLASIELLRELVDYTYWGRDRILAAALRLTPEQRGAQTWLDHGSIHGTLVHQLAAEVLLRQRWEGVDATQMLDEGDLPTIEVLRERWLEQEAAVRRHLERLSDLDLKRPVRYRSRADVDYAEPLYQLIFQNINHGSQHRSEVALSLTQLGQSTGYLDYLAYAWKRGA